MKRGTLLKTSLTVALCNAASVLLTALAGLYLARNTTQIEYGQVVYFLNLANVVLLVSGLGLSSQAILEVSRRRAAGAAGLGTDRLLAQSFYSLLAVRVVSLFAFLGVGVVWAMLAASPIPLAASACAALAVANDFFIAVLKGLERTYTVLTALVGQASIYIGLLLILPVNLGNLMFAYALSFVLAGIFSVGCVLAAGLPRPHRLSIDWRGYKSRLMFSASLYAIVLLDTLYLSLPLVVIGALGQFALAASVAVPLAVVGLLPQTSAAVVNMVYLPRLAGIAPADHERRRRFFTTMLEAIGMGSFIFAALVACYAPLFIKYLYTSRYLEVWPLLVALTPLIFLLAMTNLLTWSLVASEHSGKAVMTLALRLLAVVGAALVGALLIPSSASLILALTYLVSAAAALYKLWREWQRQLGGWHAATPLAAFAGMLIVVTLRYALPDIGSATLDELYKPLGSALIAAAVAAFIWWRAGREAAPQTPPTTRLALPLADD